MGLENLSPVLLTLLLTGLAGSFSHCLGMCGPLVLLAGARYPRQGLSAAPLHLLYHAGRILVYALLGAVLGMFGSAIKSISAVANIPGILSLFAGILVIIGGLSSLGWLPIWRTEAPLGGWWQRLVRSAVKTPGQRGIIFLGMLNGLLPCGLVYEALLIATVSARPLTGALGMLAFGLGTLPGLVLFGLGGNMVAMPLRRTLRWVGGVFVILVGVGLVLRGMAGLGVFPQML